MFGRKKHVENSNPEIKHLTSLFSWEAIFEDLEKEFTDGYIVDEIEKLVVLKRRKDLLELVLREVSGETWTTIRNEIDKIEQMIAQKEAEIKRYILNEILGCIIKYIEKDIKRRMERRKK